MDIFSHLNLSHSGDPQLQMTENSYFLFNWDQIFAKYFLIFKHNISFSKTDLLG